MIHRLCAPLVIVAGLCVGCERAEPLPDVDYAAVLAQIHAEHQPAGEDAWPLYAPLVERYWDTSSLTYVRIEEPDGGFTIRDFDCLLEGQWGDPRHEHFLAVLDEHKGIFDTLEAAAALPACVFPVSDEDGMLTVGWRTPSAFHRFAKLGAAAMRQAAHSGDWDEVERLLDIGLNMGTHVARHPSLIGPLVGAAVWQRFIREATLLALELGPPPEVAERMAARLEPVIELEGVPPTWPALAHRVEVHSLTAQNVIHQAEIAEWAAETEEDDTAEVWLHSDEAESTAPQTEEERREEKVFQAVAEGVASAWDMMEEPVTAQTFRDIDDAFDRLEAWAAQPAQERLVRGPDLPEYEYSLIGASANAMVRAFEQRDRMRVETVANVITLRLVAHRQRTGAWPGSLDDLDLGDRAVDPFFGLRFIYAAPTDPDGWPSLRVPDTHPLFSGSIPDRFLEQIHPRQPLYEDTR